MQTEPRATTLQERQQKQVERNIVGRISSRDCLFFGGISMLVEFTGFLSGQKVSVNTEHVVSVEAAADNPDVTILKTLHDSYLPVNGKYADVKKN